MTGHGASWSSRAGDESSTSSRGSGHADDDSGDGFDTAHDSRYPADVYSDAADSADDDDGGGGGSINTPVAVQTSPSQSRLLGEHYGTIRALLCDYNTRHRTRFTSGQEYMCHYDKRTGVYTLPLHGASGATYGALIAHIASAYGETCVDIGTETSASGTTTTFLYVNIVKGPSGGGAHQTAPCGNRRRRGLCGTICYALAIMVAICTVAAAADYLAPERQHGNAIASWRVASRASVAIAMASASAARKMGQMAFDALAESPAVPPTELHRDAAATAAADALPPPPPPPSEPQTDTQTDTPHPPPRQAHSPAAPVAPPDERHSFGYRLFSAVVSGVFGDALERRSGGGGAASDGVYLDYGSSDDDSAGGGGGGGDGDPRQAPEK